MANLPAPPRAFRDFIERFPKLGRAWDLLREGAEEAGALTRREQLLVKLGIAVGTLRTGPVHAAARKAYASGIGLRDLEQVVALAAPTVGLPAIVAAHGWLLEQRDHRGKPPTPKRRSKGARRAR